jgi:UDP-N-acetylmuramate: L-alanyl-gamma-D-glutamyl-meso-diaminopimelate ligase
MTQHIHLCGICGTAMASIAGLLRAQGYRVTGSDAAAYPPMSDLLRSLGIDVAQPYAAATLDPRPDLVVIGNALSRGNPEVERVLDERIPFTSMAAILRQEFLAPAQRPARNSLVVAGTHGKTTTTSMLAWIFQTAAATDPAFEPSFLIGGVAENFGTSFQLRPTLPFILEGDEYDTAFFDKGPKFLHYFPDSLILTSVEFDHADIYADLAQVQTAFRRLVNLVPRRGVILAWDGSTHITECVARAFCPVERYGFAPDSRWRIVDLHFTDGHSHWTLLLDGQPWATFSMPVAGEHNVLNATAAAALAFRNGVPVAAIQSALATFRSVRRRLEVRDRVAGITLIDDFAHHPTAIRETLRALRQMFPSADGRSGRLWAILEPRSNTLRRNVFEPELAASLARADRVLLASVFQQERIPESERLHPERVVAAITQQGTPATLCASTDEIIATLVREAAPGDVLAILSNGGFDGIYQKLPAALRAAHPEPHSEPNP